MPSFNQFADMNEDYGAVAYRCAGCSAYDDDDDAGGWSWRRPSTGRLGASSVEASSSDVIPRGENDTYVSVKWN